MDGNNDNLYKKDEIESKVFKIPTIRNTTGRSQLRASNAEVAVTPITRTPSTKKAKSTPVPARALLKESKAKDLDGLEEQFYSQASLTRITDNYFNNSSGKTKQPKASNKTMACLGNHRLSPDQASLLLGQLDPPPCSAEMVDRVAEIKRDVFPRIMAQLLAGYDILLYGFGSKMKLLDSFREKYLSCENCIVVPGFSLDINMQAILNRIIEGYMPNVRLSTRSVPAMSEAIKDYFNDKEDDKLYLIVHNIDGMSLRNSANVFTTLAQSKGIQILASVDHIHSPMIWTGDKIDWLWHDCSTLERYESETRVDNARLMSDKTKRGMASLTAVLGSLNSQAKMVFLHLATFQLGHSGPAFEGMLLDNLYATCKDHLLVNSELALRTHLTEFRDHKLVQIRQGVDRSDYIKIVLDDTSVREFVENFDNF